MSEIIFYKNVVNELKKQYHELVKNEGIKPKILIFSEKQFTFIREAFKESGEKGLILKELTDLGDLTILVSETLNYPSILNDPITFHYSGKFYIDHIFV